MATMEMTVAKEILFKVLMNVKASLCAGILKIIGHAYQIIDQAIKL